MSNNVLSFLLFSLHSPYNEALEQEFRADNADIVFSHIFQDEALVHAFLPKLSVLFSLYHVDSRLQLPKKGVTAGNMEDCRIYGRFDDLLESIH
jgi:hypothetical protein